MVLGTWRLGTNHKYFPHFQRNVTNFLHALIYLTLTLPGEIVLRSSGVGCKPYISESAALNIIAMCLYSLIRLDFLV